MTQAPTAADKAPQAAGSLDKMLSLTELCVVEGVSRWTIRRRIRAGTYPAGLLLESGREGWPENWIRERREKKVRHMVSAETAPNQAAAP